MRTVGTSHVFAPSGTGKAFKLAQQVGSEVTARFKFELEVAAYERIQKSELLRNHTPPFYGRQSVEDVVAEDGSSARSQYFMHLCFAVGLIYPDPEECKLGELFGTKYWDNVSALAKELEAFEVHDPGDASVMHWRDPDKVMVIDLAPTNL